MVFVPESECKGRAFFELANYLEFFLKKSREKINYAFFNTQFFKLYIKNYKNIKLHERFFRTTLYMQNLEK